VWNKTVSYARLRQYFHVVGNLGYTQLMVKEEQKNEKILFSFYSNVLEQWTKETLWGKVIDREKGTYKIESIPFYASVGSADIVLAEHDEDEQMLVYADTVEYSGNSTIQVVLMDEAVDIDKIREDFSELGCASEKLNDRYFVMEVLAKMEYAPIKKRLGEFRDREVLDYAESCLSDCHR
jgi:hypothetical protein